MKLKFDELIKGKIYKLTVSKEHLFRMNTNGSKVNIISFGPESPIYYHEAGWISKAHESKGFYNATEEEILHFKACESARKYVSPPIKELELSIETILKKLNL